MITGFRNVNMTKRPVFLALLVIIISMLGISCENKISVIPESDLLTLPSLTVRDFTTIVNDSGRIQLQMSSPLVEKYDNADPEYSEFRVGIKVIVYDGKDTPQAKITSKYAKVTSNNLWELRDSVVVINEKEERLETEVLYWNQEKDLIYTDRFVKITGEDQITQGIGFESDSHLTRRRIFKVTAEITLPDEE
jgi:LPS export ABC transporter protein LptC